MGTRLRTKCRNRSHVFARWTRIKVVLLQPSANALTRHCSSYHSEGSPRWCAHWRSLAETGCATSTSQAECNSLRWRTASLKRFNTAASGGVAHIRGGLLALIEDAKNRLTREGVLLTGSNPLNHPRQFFLGERDSGDCILGVVPGSRPPIRHVAACPPQKLFGHDGAFLVTLRAPCVTVSRAWKVVPRVLLTLSPTSVSSVNISIANTTSISPFTSFDTSPLCGCIHCPGNLFLKRSSISSNALTIECAAASSQQMIPTRGLPRRMTKFDVSRCSPSRCRSGGGGTRGFIQA